MKSILRILHLEDRPTDGELVKSTLEMEGIACDVVRVATRDDFLTALENDGGFESSKGFDVILADYNLPSFDGISALAMAQVKHPEIPFIFVSGVMGEDLAIETLKRGATDYVLKHRLSRLTPAVHRALSEAEVRVRREQAEEELRLSEEKYRRLFEESKDVIFISTPEGKFVDINPAGIELFGYSSKEEMPNLDIIRELYWNPEKRGEFEKLLRRQGFVQDYEVELKTKDGKKLIVLETTTAVRDEAGNITAYRGMIRDITEKKKIELQLLRAQRLESIGSLSSGIAHDLNNLFAPILIVVDMLKKKMSDEKDRRLLETLEASAKRGTDMVKQVLMFARGTQEGLVVLQASNFIGDVGKIVKETFPKNILFRTDISKDLWNLKGDPTQLLQVLLNLCINARDAMPEGGVLTLNAENVHLDKYYVRGQSDAHSGPYIVIKVIDTGAGISPDIIDKIFEPFFTTKGVGKGTGLGLSTVVSIVKIHGGFFKVYSEPGKGTEVRVHLPALHKAEMHDRARERAELPSGNGELILIVDDEASIREITKEILETYGYKVITVNDGTEAVAMYELKKNEIAVVLMDMFMPYMDGRSAIRELQMINPHVKIVTTSGLSPSEKTAKDGEKGVQVFLPKPLTAEKVLTTLHQLLTEK